MAEHGEVQGKRKRTRALRRAVRRAVRPHAHSHPFELRRKAVQLCLEEGFPVKQVARELGVGFSTLGAWVRRYRAQGEASLQGKARPRSPRPQVAAAVKRQTVELKRRQPDFGIQKISQFLRRVLFLPASQETVRRTFHAHQLLRKSRPKPQRNPPPGRASSSAPHPTSCGRPTSSPSAWAASMPT
jgi:transposase